MNANKLFSVFIIISNPAGEANLTAAELVKWVNTRLSLEGQNCYSESKISNRICIKQIVIISRVNK